MSTVPSVGAIEPPHSDEAEQAVLGAIFLSDKVMPSLILDAGIRPEDFYRERHAVIFQAMLDLVDAGEPIDILTVIDHLESKGGLDRAGGKVGVDGLAGGVPVVGNLRRYAAIVKDRGQRRRLLESTYETQADVLGGNGTTAEVIERAERAILNVAHSNQAKDVVLAGTMLEQELEAWGSRAGAMTGTASGFSDLDRITGGFQPGNLIVIAARPSMGKSALVTNIAENVSLGSDRKPVVLFSLEMAEAELAQRFIASQGSIDGEKIRNGNLRDDATYDKALDVVNWFDGAPLLVDDSSDISILEIRAKARRLQQKHGQLGLIIVDYLQLVRPDAQTTNRVQAVGEMSRGLKILARELNVPVIALSQLSRAVEQRPDKRPLLSDLRESGSIEQDADLVMFIYRDEYYNAETTASPGEAELLIAKHRNGGLGKVFLTFQGRYPRFVGSVPKPLLRAV